jgi:hypothetical protein
MFDRALSDQALCGSGTDRYTCLDDKASSRTGGRDIANFEVPATGICTRASVTRGDMTQTPIGCRCSCEDTFTYVYLDCAFESLRWSLHHA